MSVDLNEAFPGGYRLFELCHTEVRDLDNTPPEEVLPSLRRLCQYLAEVRQLFPFHLTSVYRSPEVNARVGGQKTSQHMQGLAADLIPVFPDVASGLPSIQRAMWKIHGTLFGAVPATTPVGGYPPYDQLILEYGRWVHVSIPPEGKDARREALHIYRDKDGQVHTIAYAFPPPRLPFTPLAAASNPLADLAGIPYDESEPA